MDDSTNYAHQLARLVSLLLREPSNIDAQMATLRAMATVAKLGAITVERSNAGISVNGTAIDPSLGADLAARLSAHALRGVQCKSGASADELLNVARILVAAPSGTSALSQLRELRPKNVRFLAAATTTATPQRRPAPAASPQRRPTPVASSAPARARRPTPVVLSDPPPPRRPTPIAPPSGFVQGGELWQLFSTNTPEGSADELLAQLDALTTPNADRATKLLNDLIVVAEDAARENKALLVSDVMRGMVERELAEHDEETRRAYVLAIRRASQPLILRCVAHLLPHKPEQGSPRVRRDARHGGA